VRHANNVGSPCASGHYSLLVGHERCLPFPVDPEIMMPTTDHRCGSHAQEKPAQCRYLGEEKEIVNELMRKQARDGKESSEAQGRVSAQRKCLAHCHVREAQEGRKADDTLLCKRLQPQTAGVRLNAMQSDGREEHLEIAGSHAEDRMTPEELDRRRPQLEARSHSARFPGDCEKKEALDIGKTRMCPKHEPRGAYHEAERCADQAFCAGSQILYWAVPVARWDRYANAPRRAIVATEKKLRVERFLPALGSRRARAGQGAKSPPTPSRPKRNGGSGEARAAARRERSRRVGHSAARGRPGRRAGAAKVTTEAVSPLSMALSSARQRSSICRWRASSRSATSMELILISTRSSSISSERFDNDILVPQ